MAGQHKRIIFAPNNYGLSWLEINTQSWEIVDACGAGRHLVKRACRLCDRGTRIEYRSGDHYTKINALIDKIG